ncbi:MAG TPA: EamA family transporter [Acidimicrobiia bacterium]|nr:EamA family transporter [Acidimicrobiia bacterium]
MSPGARLVLLAAVLFGTTGTAQALGPADADPLAVGAVRLLVGAAGLVVVASVRGGLRPAFSVGWGWLALGMIGVAGYQVTFFGGVRLAGVGVGTLLTIGSAPIFTGVVARLLTGERPVRAWYAATGLALVGLVLIADLGGRPDPVGVVLALAAGASYAFFSVGSDRVVSASNPVAAMAVVFGGGAVLVSPLLAMVDLGWLGSPPGYLSALWLGLAATTAAYVLYGRGLAITPVTTVATLVLAEPIVALLLATAVLREPLGLTSIAGAALVGIGLLILSRSSRHGHPAVEPVP